MIISSILGAIKVLPKAHCQKISDFVDTGSQQRVPTSRTSESIPLHHRRQTPVHSEFQGHLWVYSLRSTHDDIGGCFSPSLTAAFPSSFCPRRRLRSATTSATNYDLNATEDVQRQTERASTWLSSTKSQTGDNDYSFGCQSNLLHSKSSTSSIEITIVQQYHWTGPTGSDRHGSPWRWWTRLGMESCKIQDPSHKSPAQRLDTIASTFPHRHCCNCSITMAHYIWTSSWPPRVNYAVPRCLQTWSTDSS